MVPSGINVTAPSFIDSTIMRYGISDSFRVTTWMPLSRFTTNASTIYSWMARRVSSVSARRLFNSSASSWISCCIWFLFAIVQITFHVLRLKSTLLLFTQVQSHENTFRIREVANDLFDGLRQLSDQSGDGKDLIAACEL